MLLALITTLFVCLSEAETTLATWQGSAPTRSAAPAQQPRPININRATFAELRSLPGIGPATARRILEYRAKNPPFRRVEELLIIRGISRRRLERIRNQICLD
jgi:competence protein ComEA